MLSEICDKINYIFLETKELNFIGRILFLKKSPNYLILVDGTTRKVQAFDENGKYLFEIAKQGKGPGEYQRVDDLVIDEPNHCVYLSAGNAQILKYSLDNKYLGTITLDVGPRYISTFAEGFIAIVKCPNTLRFSGYTFNFLGYDGKLKRQELRHDISNFTGKEPLSYSSTFHIGDTLYLWESYFDTIYGVTKKGHVVPKWTFNYGKEQITQKQLQSVKTVNEVIQTGFINQTFTETTKTVFVSAVNAGYEVHMILNKEKHEYLKLTNSNGLNNFLIINDIDGIVDFWPSYSTGSDETMMVIEPKYFKMAFEQAKLKHLNNKLIADYGERVDRLGEFDNPILFFVKHK
jgi:hypothetical protein